jgi:sec-independent protein translocase protein TatB
MFDFAWSELAIIGLVAVVVLGPKELPQAMRAAGRFSRQARKLASEFQGHVNDLVREAELDEVRNSVQKVASADIGTEVNKMLDPGGDFAAELARTEEEMQAALRGTEAAMTGAGDAIAAEASATPATETAAVGEAIAEAPITPVAPDDPIVRAEPPASAKPHAEGSS